MKTNLLLGILTILLTNMLSAQIVNYSLNQTYIAETEMFPFDANDYSYGLSISGSIVLNSDSSIVRIILVDQNLNEYLVFEGIKLICPNGDSTLTNVCFETCFLDNILLRSIKLEISDASFYFSSILNDKEIKTDIENLISNSLNQMRTHTIETINSFLERNNTSWRAGDVPMARLTYSEKKQLYGEQLPNLQGFDYFAGGFFSFTDDDTPLATNDIISNFDWRDRHGSNMPNTPYYNAAGYGWISPRTVTQVAAECWAFAPVYTLQSLANIYFNQQINMNLSEQDAISCSNGGTYNGGGSFITVLNYMKNTGVVNESCFPFTSNYQAPCSNKCSNPVELVKINDHTKASGNELQIKSNLVNYGPLVTSVSKWSHAMEMVGFGVVKAGDIIMDGNSSYTGLEISVPYNSPDIGKPYYIFKQSWGSWGIDNSPFINVIINANSTNPSLLYAHAINTQLTSLEYNAADILCNDFDGDGYYYWGIGSKPNSCPPNTPVEPDCDDSNPFLGPYDTMYGCTILCDNFTHSSGTINIITDEIWDTDHYINMDMIIEEGSTLTIKNCIVNLSKHTKIVVKQSGKLIIEGAILTNPCGEYWRGIEVWGNRNESQIPLQGEPNAQGKIVLKNGAVIENAENAITLSKPDQESWHYNGGIVQAEDAVFINNRRSVEFMSYQNKHPYSGAPIGNISYFKNCRFEVNDGYFAPSSFFAHISMWDVDGINIYSCNFISNMNNNPNTGVGILTENTFFNVLPTCSSPVTPCPANDIVPNTFHGLHYGIHSASSGVGTKTINVKNAEFYGNNYGIKLSAVNYATIINSTFNVGGYLGGEAECGYLYGVGIELLNSTGFSIEENSFYKVYGDPEGYFVGTYIAETQAADQVYRNIFYNLSYGNYAVGKNWEGTETWQGLAYYCNQNTWNWQDITVAKNAANPPVGGIQSPIGTPSLPAGNTFSTPNVADHHIYNGGDHWLGYFYYAPSPGNTGTSYYPSKVYRVIREEVVGIQNQCPPNYGGGGSASERDVVLTPAQKQQEEIAYASALSDYNNVKTLYDNLKDGGNTTATLTDIAIAWPSDMWQLRAELLGKSPHLSMEVLKAAADKTDVLPESIIFEILAANPDELKKDELINYLEDKQNPLLEYMVDILRQVAMGSSYKTVLQRQMAHYSQEKTRAAHNIIRSLLNDTISNNDELRNWFDNIGGKRADEQIIATYMSESNFSNALSLANMMPSLYNYIENELDEHNYYMQMLNLQIGLAQQQRTIFDLDSTEVANLVFIAGNSTGTAGAQAKGILEFAYGYHFYNCIDPEESGMKSGKYLNPVSPEKIYGIEITARPNPAKAWVAFNYTLPLNDPQGVIKISDLSGKEIASIPISGKQGQQIWDTRADKPGVYFYTLNTAGFSKHGKIVISQ